MQQNSISIQAYEAALAPGYYRPSRFGGLYGDSVDCGFLLAELTRINCEMMAKMAIESGDSLPEGVTHDKKCIRLLDRLK